MRFAINASEYNGQYFGPEDEYTVKRLIGGIEGILTDLSTLTGAPARFVRFSNHGERSALVTHFRTLNSSLTSESFEQVATSVDAIKPIIRAFGVRHTFERLSEFDSHVDQLQAKAISMQDALTTFEETQQAADAVNEELTSLEASQRERLESLEERLEELKALLQKTDGYREEAENLLEKDKENSELSEEYLQEVEANKKVVEGFSKRVTQRETQLDDQEAKTEAYNEKLKAFTEERDERLQEAQGLIDNAKTALEYKTAEGLSAAFISKLQEAKEDDTTGDWLKGAAAFFVGAIGVGIWILSDSKIDTEVLVGRITLIPMMIAGAWFCAGQYIKQKNLIEDYAYKSVLAKSIVGFSEQLATSAAKGDEYAHYIKSVLSEIHNDPLLKKVPRKHDEDVLSDIKKMVSDLKKALKGESE